MTIHRGNARIKPVLALLLLAGISCQTSCTRQIANFGKMEVNPTTLKLRLRDKLPWLGKPSSDYYFRFRLATDGTGSIISAAEGKSDTTLSLSARTMLFIPRRSIRFCCQGLSALSMQNPHISTPRSIKTSRPNSSLCFI
jgi:hypothetical protein